MTDYFDWKEESFEDSVYAALGLRCEVCGNPLDHPPIQMLLKAPTVMDGPKNAKPILQGKHTLCCRWCVLEALAPIGKPVEENKRAGWLHRSILRGELEPSGMASIGESRVGEKVGPTEKTGHGDSKDD